MKKLMIAGIILGTISSTYAFIPQFESNKSNRKSKKVKRSFLKLKNFRLNSISMNSLKKSSKNNTIVKLEEKALAQNKNGLIRVQQDFKGIPVYGSEAIFEIENGKVISRDGRVSHIQSLDINPIISKQMSLQIALRERNSKYNSKLVIYPSNEGSRLVWWLVEDHFSSQVNIFVDAKNGKIVEMFNALSMGHGHGHDGVSVNVDSSFDSETKNYVLKLSDRVTYNAHNKGEINNWGQIIGLPGELATSENDTWSDAAEVDAHNFAGDFLKVLKDKFNRDSYDNKGAKVVSTVHFMKKFVNAFWNGRQMVYGDGDGRTASNLAGALDVVAHEISHAITTSTSKLVYKNESGALNESFSDIMATYAEYVIQKDKFDWFVGEDVWTPSIKGDALRYMDNPMRGRNPNPRPGREWAYSRDHYTDLYKGRKDNGGVHINSGISNLAFYLLSKGGIHPTKPSISVRGIGIEAAIRITYEAFTERLVSSSNFSDARLAMIKVAKRKYGSYVAESVEQAWSAVGVE